MIKKYVIFKQIQRVGKKLFNLGLNNSHSGNISVRSGNFVYITHTGSMLDDLKLKSIVKVHITDKTEKDKNASMELIVHRAIYQSNPQVNAIVHAHAPYSVIMGIKNREIIPVDMEGQYYLKCIPVMKVKNTIASADVAKGIKKYTQNNNTVIVDKHGVFAWGKTLEEAYHYISVTESACRINYLAGQN
ncbi:MAG: class II aldolase/adducin family protein [Candidatus Margulisbacteria bacterium]|nr:class II aldolase/adducin family protein [Candidatus Margulisiibacteriota bacterium]